MNERIYRSARLQYFGLWTVTIALPFLVTWLLTVILPNTSKFHLPLWGAILTGLAIAFGAHFLMRRLSKHVYLFGTAIYDLYKRERKMEASQVADILGNGDTAPL